MMHAITNYNRLPDDIVAGFKSQATATIYEASGRKGYISHLIKPIAKGVTVCGSAFTVQCAPGDNLMLHKALEIAKPGDVIIATTGGAYEYGYWGGLMTVSGIAGRLGGLVIDGCVRDSAEIAEMGFPVFCRGFSVRGTTKASLGLINYPLPFGGQSIEAGDLIFGDDDGLVTVKAADCAEVLENTIKRTVAEEQKKKTLGSGISSVEYNKLAEVFAKLGYAEEAR